MSTPAVYTFKDDPSRGREDLHLVHNSDGYPEGAADLIPELLEVAQRIWSGEDVDLSALNMPRVDKLTRRATLEE